MLIAWVFTELPCTRFGDLREILGGIASDRQNDIHSLFFCNLHHFGLACTCSVLRAVSAREGYSDKPPSFLEQDWEICASLIIDVTWDC